MSTYYNFILILSLLSFYGAAVYRLYRLNYLGIFLTLIFTAITYILLKKLEKVKKISDFRFQISDFKNIKLLTYLLLISYFALLVINFYTLFKSATTESIISPWEVVPTYFFITFTVSTLLLTFIILKTKLSNLIYYSLFTVHYLLMFSIALIIYKIGFGFDSFIHQATENLISQIGVVHPKPFYYLGQYALIIIINKIFFIPVVMVDKLLVPLLAALLLPPAIFYAAKSFIDSNRATLLTTLFSLILPFSFFIVTTPQNLSYLFLIVLILLSLINDKNLIIARYRLLVAVALATLTIHPISGIPAIIFVAILLIKQFVKNKKIFLAAYCLLLISATVVLPAAFYINNQTSVIINDVETGVSAAWQLPELFLSKNGNIWLNFAYLYGFNISIILTLLIIIGIALYYHKQKFTFYSLLIAGYSSHLLISLALVISYFLTSNINFSYLINYERGNFSDRILILAAIFSLPFILITLSTVLKKILAQEAVIKYSLICAFAFLLSCSLYYSYPRHDNYYNSRSFSSALADIRAAQWIENDARDNNFIVLANQPVSAAALKEFGFKKYYETKNGQLFYYPIPTGDKLYQYYLKMVNEKATKKTALEAADLVGVNTIYFVINNYWFGFEKILAEAKYEANARQSISDGKVFVFKFTR